MSRKKPLPLISFRPNNSCKFLNSTWRQRKGMERREKKNCINPVRIAIYQRSHVNIADIKFPLVLFYRLSRYARQPDFWVFFWDEHSNTLRSCLHHLIFKICWILLQPDKCIIYHWKENAAEIWTRFFCLVNYLYEDQSVSMKISGIDITIYTG